MTRMDCAQLEDAAAELALGILPAARRAAAVAHLDRCMLCQQTVAGLEGVAGRLLLLSSPADPSPQLESRVLATVAADHPASAAVVHGSPIATARRRIPGVVLAVAASCLAVLAFVGLNARSSGPAVAAGEMRTAAGDVVGEIVILEAEPARAVMTLPGWDLPASRYDEPVARYWLRVDRTNGPALTAPVTMTDDARATAALDVDPEAITTAALVDSTGRVWCSVTF
jgi:hypothetical protein